ncbi:MAG: hypothetical protein EAZ60_13425 [Oscillatoriales cyanobacterium]|nr:MAG: hypothetical protein EAZ83_09080 [Oscillatoriales cyanobacterium]TAE94222.1 MAG: hypothetical protein EAZ79_24075 [Oscillatoriales cyanobacterium]TAF30846.1 MAG: hypothetical protein EAZ69_20905 [Oscillatoriales cyanobacterium]TAF55375.1 MAG: hypothetical protein EAZ60_13425 [Oscillatoriales cyanobacterium]
MLIAAVAAVKIKIYVRKRKPLSMAIDTDNLGNFSENLHRQKLHQNFIKNYCIYLCFGLD